MNHLSLAAGFDFAEVQLAMTISPILYLAASPVILGPKGNIFLDTFYILI